MPLSCTVSEILSLISYDRGSVLLRQGDEIPKRMGAILAVFLPIDNALYSIAFGTHTKTAEPIEMPFGMLSGLSPRNSVLHRGDDLRREMVVLGANMCPTSLIPLLIANWTGPCSCTR